MVGAVDRVLDVEHRRDVARQALAVLDLMAPSGRSAMICSVVPFSAEP